MAKSTDPFRIAIKNSLSELRIKGGKINAQVIINNAKYPDGTPVGKTTLYKKKGDGSGERIHEDLIQEILEAKDGRLKSEGKATRSETIKGNREKIQDLEQQLKNVASQIIEQEERMNRALANEESDRDVASRLEEDLFVLYSIIADFSPRGSLINNEANKFIRKYEIKSEQTTIKRAKNTISEYIGDMKDSTLVQLN